MALDENYVKRQTLRKMADRVRYLVVVCGVRGSMNGVKFGIIEHNG